MTGPAAGALLPNLLRFGRVLRGLGLATSPGRMIDLLDALSHVGLGRRDDVRSAARCLFVQRREDLPLFDAAFDAFWRKPAVGTTTLDLRAMGERRRFRRPRFGPPPLARADAAPAGEAPPAESPEPPLLQTVLTWSPDEVLRHKDFAELTAGELAEVEAWMVRLTWRVRERRTRRLRPGGGPRPDLRRTLRKSLRHGGEVLGWARRERKTKARPLVVLADVSGSMERYTRLLLFFLYGLAEGLGSRVEAFAFGTRLTRITRALRGQALDRALAEVARLVPDWSGGTRIGEVLRAFNRGWGRRVLAHGPVVLLVSDGWDRGEPELLVREMARLQRSCHRLVWLNPLLGAPDYEPLARGMRSALPYVDDFLPVHSLASLQDLGGRLAALPARRAPRPRWPVARPVPTALDGRS